MNENIRKQMLLIMAMAEAVSKNAPHLMGSVHFAPFPGAILLLAGSKEAADSAMITVSQHLGENAVETLIPLIGDAQDLGNDTVEVITEVVAEAISQMKVNPPTLGFMDRVGYVVDFSEEIPADKLEDIRLTLETAGGCSGKFQRFLVSTPSKLGVIEVCKSKPVQQVQELSDPVRSRLSKITDDNISDLRILLNTTMTVEDFLEKIDTLGGTDG